MRLCQRFPEPPSSLLLTGTALLSPELRPADEAGGLASLCAQASQAGRGVNGAHHWQRSTGSTHLLIKSTRLPIALVHIAATASSKGGGAEANASMIV